MPNLLRVLVPKHTTRLCLTLRIHFVDHLKRFTQIFMQLVDARGGAAVALDFAILFSGFARSCKNVLDVPRLYARRLRLLLPQ